MEGERVNVSFTCQRCLQPVIVDDSFSNMDDYAKAELDRKYLIKCLAQLCTAPLLLLWLLFIIVLLLSTIVRRIEEIGKR